MLDELLPGLIEIGPHVDRIGSEKEIESVFKSACLKLDKRLKEKKDIDSGTTAICATITQNSIIIANLGDSRALFSQKNGSFLATKDHKPKSPSEKKRIEDAGGLVLRGRVNANLATSRALGDFDLKNVPGLPPTKQPVSSEPDVYVLERNPANDDFLVLASDGVYDMFDNEELRAFIQNLLKSSKSLEDVVSQILDESFSRGSMDNMTLTLIVFG